MQTDPLFLRDKSSLKNHWEQQKIKKECRHENLLFICIYMQAKNTLGRNAAAKKWTDVFSSSLYRPMLLFSPLLFLLQERRMRESATFLRKQMTRDGKKKRVGNWAKILAWGRKAFKCFFLKEKNSFFF